MVEPAAHELLPPGLLLDDCNDDDRADLLRAAQAAQIAGAAGAASLGEKKIALVSLSLEDAAARIAAHRSAGRRTLALGTKAQARQRIAARAAGSEEFLTTNPVAPPEYAARMALLRTGSALPEGFRIDADHACVIWRNQGWQLSEREIRLLSALATARGGVVSHAELLRAGWGDRAVNRRNYLQVAITRLRARLERDPQLPTLLLTEAAIGYRLGTGGDPARYMP